MSPFVQNTLETVADRVSEGHTAACRIYDEAWACNCGYEASVVTLVDIVDQVAEQARIVSKERRRLLSLIVGVGKDD